MPDKTSDKMSRHNSVQLRCENICHMKSWKIWIMCQKLCQTKCLNICEETWQININKLRYYATWNVICQLKCQIDCHTLSTKMSVCQVCQVKQANAIEIARWGPVTSPLVSRPTVAPLQLQDGAGAGAGFAHGLGSWELRGLFWINVHRWSTFLWSILECWHLFRIHENEWFVNRQTIKLSITYEYIL